MYSNLVNFRVINVIDVTSSNAWVLGISDDPLYFMPNNDVQNIIGLDYVPFLIIYIVFMAVYVNLFYLINDRENVYARFHHKKHIKA